MRGRTFALLLAGAAVSGLLLVGIPGSAPQRSAFDGGPGAPLLEDATHMGADPRRVVSTPAAALARADAPATLFAVFQAPSSYSDAEVEAIQGFLGRGGRVLLAAPFDGTNGLLAPFGVVSERVRLVEPEGPGAIELDGRSFRVNRTASSAFHLEGGDPAVQVLSVSRAGSFLDRDGNGTVDAQDPQGRFVTAVAVTVGTRGGLLVALADRLPFESRGADELDHSELRLALLERLLPQGGVVLVDESRWSAPDPLAQAAGRIWAAGALAPWRWVLVAVACAALLAARVGTLPGQWHPHRFLPDRFVSRRELGAPAAGSPQDRATGWTRRGVELLAAASAAILLGIAFQEPSLAIAGCLLAVPLAFAGMVAAPKVDGRRTIDRLMPVEGTPLQVGLSITSHRRSAVRVEVRDHLPDTFDVVRGTNWFSTTVAPGASMEVAYEAVPSVRGAHPVGPLAIRSRDWMGLRCKQVEAHGPHAATVVPREQNVRRLPFRTRVPSVTMGPHLVNRAGDGSEFHALRGYVQGESMRNVNWKASARAGELMVNQRIHESMTRLTILLDARRVSAAGPASCTPLAQACRAALSVGNSALRVRDQVRLVTYGDGVRAVPLAGGPRQMHTLRRELAEVVAQGETTLQEAVDATIADLAPNNPVVVVSGLEGDETVPSAMRTLRGRGVLPVLVAMPIDVAGDAPASPGAQAILRRRREVLAELRGMGIPVHESVDGLSLDDLFRIGGTP